MNAAAEAVMEEFTDVILSYGQSDEYSFVFSKKCDLWSRREVKIVTNLVSCFTANYVMKWNEFFPEMKLKRPPQFDGRVVTYPSDKDIRDYLSWRQVDCKHFLYFSLYLSLSLLFLFPLSSLMALLGHVNNQYNTCFWSLVLSGMGRDESYGFLNGTDTEFKNELLFTKFGINYSKIDPVYRKGTIVIRRPPKVKMSRQEALVSFVSF